MRVAMYYNNQDIRIQELPVPEIGPGEVLMQTVASGICGSDVLEWYRMKKSPLVLGHEVAGEVVKVGRDVERFQLGDRIVAAHHVPCNACYYCLTGHHTACETLRQTNFDPGGFSEYIRIPAINVDRGTHVIPAELSYEEATFHEPLGCVIRAYRRVGFLPGQSLLVLGSGMAGILSVHYARHIGAGRILAVDPVQSRRETSLKFGADEVVKPDEDVKACMQRINQGRLADLVFVSTGAEQAQHQALECVERGGTVLFFAPTEADVKIPVSINQLFFRNDITLTTSYGASPYDSWLALELMQEGSFHVKDMITHRLPLGETAKGFQIVASAQNSLKVIIEPQK